MLIRWCKRVLLGILVLALLLSAGFLLWREYCQYQVQSERAITTDQGIEVLEPVMIGGIEQWISVRGQDLANPVLLYLHGGPGSAMMPFSHVFQTPWEKHFTVVQWDQRGSGKTYTNNDPEQLRSSLSLDRMVEDARELSDYLRQRFGKDKIIVLGHSWGTMLGMVLVQKYPELFHAYVGTGVVISVQENERVGYQQALKVARQRNIPEAIADLESVAPYPHPTKGTKDTRPLVRKWQREFGFTLYGITGAEFMRMMVLAGIASPDYTLPELGDLIQNTSSKYSSQALATDIDGFDIRPFGYEYQLPIVFLLGRHDWQTPSVIAEDFFDKLAAPYKELVWFEQSAHGVPSEEPDKFFNTLVERVRPLAIQ